MRKVAILVVVILIAAAACGAIWLRRELARPYCGFSTSQVFVDIPRGTSRWNIAGLLQHNGVIHSRTAFLLLSERRHRSALQAGEYMFDKPATPRQIFEQIAGGHIFVHVVVVPEGWTMFDIAAELQKQRLCTKAEFLRIAANPSLVRDIAPQAKSLEGFLFPSTYRFSRGASAEEMAATMVHEFREEWRRIQASDPLDSSAVRPPLDPAKHAGAAVKHADAAVKPALSTDEIVTLASLIERETPQPQERPIVSSVFHNRLKLGLPLQCDPTVQYALDLMGKPILKVAAADLHVPSPYNTYLHRGLPPGPIANPGDASLRAALHPAQTHYLYFVANGAGGHFFSSTLAQHNRNVEKYRRILAGLPPEPPQPVRAHVRAARKGQPARGKAAVHGAGNRKRRRP